MKIFPIADLQSDWYPKEAVLQFKKYSQITLVDSLAAADVIWIMSYYLPLTPLLSLPESVGRLVPFLTKRRAVTAAQPIVTTIHHLVPTKHRLWQPKINILKKITTAWHFPSPKNQEICRSIVGNLSQTIHLPYWIDTKIFFPLAHSQRDALRKKYNLPLHHTIIGSFQRDTEKDLVSPKLEKGPDTFCDSVEMMDRHRIHILLSGTRRNYIEQRLTKANITYTNVGKVPFTEMNTLYNILDYYLVTSRYEGGPQAILESMATRTPIFSTPVGIADLLSPETIFTTPAEAVVKLQQKYSSQTLDRHFTAVQNYRCEVVIPRYDHFFQKLVSQ